MYQSGKGYKAISKALDSSEPRSEPLSTNGETCNSGEPSQELAGRPKLLQRAMTTHPGGHKRTQNNI